MTKPITPAEVGKAKTAAMPQEVIAVFNELIAAAWDGHSAVVKQSDAADLIAARLDISRGDVFNRKLLDVEPIFEAHGWKVEYDKPGYNETYPATFTFTVRTRGRNQ